MTTSLRVTRPRTRRVAAAAAAALMALGLGLTGCSSDQDSAASSDSGGSSAGGDGGSDVAAPETQDGGAPGVAEDSGGSGGSDSSGGSTRTSARALPDDGRDIVYTGSVTVRVRDVATATRRVETMTLALGGVVFSEETSQLPGKRRLGRADLTLRVPPAAFGSTLRRFCGRCPTRHPTGAGSSEAPSSRARSPETASRQSATT